MSGYYLSHWCYLFLLILQKVDYCFPFETQSVVLLLLPTVLCWTSSLSLSCSFAPNQCMFGSDLAWNIVLHQIILIWRFKGLYEGVIHVSVPKGAAKIQWPTAESSREKASAVPRFHSTHQLNTVCIYSNCHNKLFLQLVHRKQEHSAVSNNQKIHQVPWKDQKQRWIDRTNKNYPCIQTLMYLLPLSHRAPLLSKIY